MKGRQHASIAGVCITILPNHKSIWIFTHTLMPDAATLPAERHLVRLVRIRIKYNRFTYASNRLGTAHATVKAIGRSKPPEAKVSECIETFE